MPRSFWFNRPRVALSAYSVRKEYRAKGCRISGEAGAVARRVVSTSRRVASFLQVRHDVSIMHMYALGYCGTPCEDLLFVNYRQRPIFELGDTVEAADFDEGAYEKRCGLKIGGSTGCVRSGISCMHFLSINNRASGWCGLFHGSSMRRRRSEKSVRIADGWMQALISTKLLM